MRRRLAAIISIDVAGYTRLMARDEAGALDALTRCRAELVDPLAARHYGRVIKLMGDGALIEFASVVDAVRFAVGVQVAMQGREPDAPEDRRIRFRIGVNLGDVIVDGDDIHGDGVNLAARLEGLAAPGGVTVAAAVHEQVAGKLDLTFDGPERRSVKNVAEPVAFYAVRLDGKAAALAAQTLAEPAAAAPAKAATHAPASGLRRLGLAGAAALAGIVAVAAVIATRVEAPAPIAGSTAAAASAERAAAAASGSIAVLPFAYAGGEGGDGLLGDGLAEDIVAALARFGDLTVIASESSAAYRSDATPLREIGEALGVRHVLKGAIERDGERLRITVRLFDAATGRQLWTERHDAEGTDIFAVRDSVAQSVAAQLGEAGGALAAATLAQSKRKDTDRLEAYELVLLAAELRHRFEKADNAQSLALLERAVALDPHYARAHADLAWTHWQDVINAFSDAPEASIREAVESAEAAIRADPYFSDGYWVLASVSICGDDPAKGVALFQKALELNPAHPGLLVEWGGYVLPQTLDRAEEGLALVERAMQLNPRYPDWYNGARVSALLFARQPEEAIRAYAAVRYPQAFVRVLHAAALGHAGRTEEGRRVLAEVLPEVRGLTLSTLADNVELCGKGASEAALGYLREGLALAGLPE